MSLLKVEDLHTEFKTDQGIVHAVRGVSFELNQGEVLGIVGESGSGKSQTMYTIMGLLSENALPVKGKVTFDGKDIRNGLVAIVSIKHPDSESFIDAKMTEGKVTGANVSVKIDDEFMQAVINGTPYKQQYPIDSSEPTNVKEINAAELWKKIIHNAWKSAEPGVLFWDTILRESVPDSYADLGFRTVSRVYI